MKPETIQKLREYPEVKELITYLRYERGKLDSLSALKDKPIDDYYFLVVGRLHAKELIDEILGTLLTPVDSVVDINPQEYVV